MPVDWSLDDEIVITTSTFESRQAEKFTIKTISDDRMVLELNSKAEFAHTAHQHSGKTLFSLSLLDRAKCNVLIGP